MPRPRKHRCCRALPGQLIYKPAGIPLIDQPIRNISIDELEAMRLCDLEGKSQQQAADAMQVSRGTVQRLLQSGRRTLLNAILAREGIAFSNLQGAEKE